MIAVDMKGIKFEKGSIQFEGEFATLLAEITMLIREINEQCGGIDEETFELIKDLSLKPKEQIKKELLEDVTKDIDNILNFLQFLQRLKDEADD